MRVQWKRVGQVTGAAVPAGPITNATTANAAVLRTRRAAEWATKHTTKFTLLAAATLEPPLVVDRSGLIRALTADIAQAHESPEVGARLREAVVLSRTLRQLAENLPLAWTVTGEKTRQLLVAPNIWAQAQSRRLDLNDYARLVAARGLLWDSLFGAAPWLAPRFLRQIISDSGSRAELLRDAMLFDQLVTNQLANFTPRALPSINWLRQKEPPAFWMLLHTAAGVSQKELADMKVRVETFTTAVDLPGHPRAFWALLQDPTNLPTDAELDDPHLWRRRLGYAN